MKSIAFLSPYQHLPKFKKFVHKNFKCSTITNFADINTDYIFYAPNYGGKVLKDSHLVGTKVKGILTPSTGTNHIEVDKIPVYSIKNSPILNEIYSTAEHALFLILSITRKVTPIVELKESTLGILGYGRLGKMMKGAGKGIFKKVVIKDLDFEDKHFFSHTDFLSIHIDHTIRNEKFVNREFISKFKKDIFIINTSRGEVVNEIDILDMLDEGKVKGYATDVVTGEHTSYVPLLKSFTHDKLIVTNHIGGIAITAQEKAYREVLKYVL